MDIEISNESVSYSYNFPQHLCKMCGKCCRAITTPYSYDELLKFANDGQEEAKVFIEVFKRYDSIEQAKKAVPEHVENIIKQLKKNNPELDESTVTFFYCPYVTDDNKCSIHSTRPDCCRRAPRNGWSLFPPGCGYKGWQFQQREKVKASIRKLKEYLMDLELLDDSTYIPTRKMTVAELREFVNDKIKPWKKYGADYW